MLVEHSHGERDLSLELEALAVIGHLRVRALSADALELHEGDELGGEIGRGARGSRGA